MEKNENIFSLLPKQFKKELESIVAQILVRSGVKKNSDVIQSIEFTETNSRDSLFMYVSDYYRHVSNGRRPRAKKIPIQALVRFIKKNNISSGSRSVNQIAYAMQNSIYKAGIKGKNFITTVENSVSDYVEIQIADFLEEYLADSLYTSFAIQ